MDLHDWPYYLKSARRKKRLVKKDRDKQLIQLAKLKHELWNKKCRLPMIPLEQPYQKGWKRFFVLRTDVQQSPKAAFFQGILDKINTTEFNHDKGFTRRVRKRWRYHVEERPQTLRPIYEHEWFSDKLSLNEVEKLCFYRDEKFSELHKRVIVTYLYDEPWRFVLAVKPRIICEAKVHDQLLEQELQEATDRIDSYDSWPRIHRLTSGRSYRYWSVKYFDKPKYINTLKNKPMYIIQDEYTD